MRRRSVHQARGRETKLGASMGAAAQPDHEASAVVATSPPVSMTSSSSSRSPAGNTDSSGRTSCQARPRQASHCQLSLSAQQLQHRGWPQQSQPSSTPASAQPSHSGTSPGRRPGGCGDAARLRTAAVMALGIGDLGWFQGRPPLRAGPDVRAGRTAKWETLGPRCDSAGPERWLEDRPALRPW